MISEGFGFIKTRAFVGLVGCVLFVSIGTFFLYSYYSKYGFRETKNAVVHSLKKYSWFQAPPNKRDIKSNPSLTVRSQKAFVNEIKVEKVEAGKNSKQLDLRGNKNKASQGDFSPLPPPRYEDFSKGALKKRFPGNLNTQLKELEKPLFKGKWEPK